MGTRDPLDPFNGCFAAVGISLMAYMGAMLLIVSLYLLLR